MLAAGQGRLPAVATSEVDEAILFLFPFRVFSRVSRAIFPLPLGAFRGQSYVSWAQGFLVLASRSYSSLGE